MTTDDGEKESETLNYASLEKAIKYSIPREKVHHTHTANTHVSTPDTMITDDLNEKPMAAKSVDQEEGNRDSIPRVELRHKHKGKAEYVFEESLAEENTNTSTPAYSIDHPVGKDSVEKGHAHKDDRFEDNRGSEPRPAPIETKKDPVDALNDTSDCDRPVYNAESDSEVHNKGTNNDPVAVIHVTTDDSENELVTLNFASQGKVTRGSIPWEKIHHTHTRPELEDDKDNTNTNTNRQAWFSNHPDGRKFAETDDLKEVTDDTYDQVRPEDDHEKVTAPELEIRFGINDFRTGYDEGKNDIYKFNELIKVVFQIIPLPKGMGLHSICQPEQDIQPGCDINTYAPADSSEDDHANDCTKEISGTITLVVGNKGNEHPNLIVHI